MPPPDYPLVQENPHKVTVEKVLKVIMDELKSIIKRDMTRRMIEGIAFKAFEDWWDCQEKKAKVSSLPPLLFRKVNSQEGKKTPFGACWFVVIIVFVLFIRYKFLL